MAHLTLYYQVLDFLFDDWEKREDTYYFTQLANLLKIVFGEKEHIKTIIEQLQESEVENYTDSFRAILKSDKRIIQYFFDNRLERDREKANFSRFVKKQIENKNPTLF